MTTKAEIEGWLSELYDNDDYSHMIVACDTFNYEDFPVYVTKDEDVREKASEYRSEDRMLWLMEVYSKNHTLEEQMNERRAFNYD